MNGHPRPQLYKDLGKQIRGQYPERSPESPGQRRGLYPKPESPAEKLDRLRQKGYYAEPLIESVRSEKTKFSDFDLGNKNLPAYAHKQEIISALDNNRIILLCGPTGSGKTTQIAQYALEAGYDRVVFLQPRRINADNTGERIAFELNEQLGDELTENLVGINHSERNSIADRTVVQIMTSGTFTKKLPKLNDEWGDLRVLIVADETHENNIETEFAAAHAVKQVEAHDKWRIAFASATPDRDAITKSYEVVNGGSVPVVEIKGRPHEISMTEESDCDVAESYHRHSAGHSKAMIFVEGIRAINKTIARLKDTMNKEDLQRTKFFKLHAQMGEEAKKLIFETELQPGERMIVVSTSAGQSGITVPGLGLVISSGITKSPELDDEGAPGLPARHCTQAELLQQAGRSGRDIAGGEVVLSRPVGFDLSKNRTNKLYHFVPLESRDRDIPPEIYNSNITRNILACAAMGDNFFELNNYLKNSVSEESICEAYDVLSKLGAVDDYDQITGIGLEMDRFPLRPELSRALVGIGERDYNMQIYALAIAAAIESGGLADYYSQDDKWYNECVRDTTEDDFIAQLDMMLMSREYFNGRENSVSEQKLEDMGLAVRNTHRAHRQFDKMCRIIGIEPRDFVIDPPSEYEENELRSMFLSGMADQVYKKIRTDRGTGIYANVWGYDEAIERQISDRSLLSRMGQSAVGLVVGYPRWYVKSLGSDIRSYVIDTCFSPSREQVHQVLGQIATRNLHTDLRNGNLIRSGKASLGSLDLGMVKAVPVPAETPGDISMLSRAVMASSHPAVLQLTNLVDDDIELFGIIEQYAQGAYAVNQVGDRLWEKVASLGYRTR